VNLFPLLTLILQDDGMDNDIFATIFGFPFGRRSRRPQKMRGEDVVITLQVSLEDLYTGKEVKQERERTIICKSCEG
jgi:DnaJ family protein A protein 2